jgi:NlpC/P60 family putative phage cell wall peptidase
MVDLSSTRLKVIEIARSWLGTPYHHQASLKGVGCDCIGLIRGIYKEIYGIEIVPAPYSRDWGDHSKNESILEAGEKYLEEVPIVDSLPGDVIAIRWIKQGIAKHAAILSFNGRMIHSYEGSGVVETNIVNTWSSKFIRAFKFPEVS